MAAASHHLLDTDRVRLTREYWTDTGRRALQTAGSAVTGATVISLPYGQIVTVGQAGVVAGIAAGLSLVSSLAIVGVQQPRSPGRWRTAIETGIQVGLQTSVAIWTASVLKVMSAPFHLVVLSALLAAVIGGYWTYASRRFEVQPESSSWASTPEVGASESMATNAIAGLSEFLAGRAVEQPQVKAAGLNPDELRTLRDEIRAEIRAHAQGIARSTSSYYERYLTAKSRYAREVGVPVLSAGVSWYRWTALFLMWLALVVAITPTLSRVAGPAALSYGVLVVSAAAFTAGGLWGGRRSLRTGLNAAGVAVYAGVTLLLASLWPGVPSAAARTWTAAGLALAAGVAFLLWRWAKSGQETILRVVSDNDEDWPPGDSPARREAVQSRREWINALHEFGVLPILSAKIDRFAARSYATTLPEASVGKLGDITELTQFVPTETSRQLTRMMASMPTAAIGLSGPRGVGKSTVLRVLGDDRFRSNSNDRGLIVPAPTSYDSREFLVHLFVKLCEIVVPPTETTPRRRWPWVALVLGLTVIGLAAAWPALVDASRWARGNPRIVAALAGLALVLVAAVAYVRSGRLYRDTSIEDLARHHLRTLRYLETQTVTHTGQAKLPIGIDLGRQRARQRAEIAKSYPELVDDFREFLDQVGLSLRSRAQNARVVVCIDELDKIDAPEQAERFLNDIKAIFQVRGSFFLVSVSEDAMTSFSRRALAVRTTFDTAFDAVVQVGRFSLTDTRALLVQQVIRLPEPFVWFCHCLSGGLPRDLGRTVRALYDVRSAANVDALAELATRLVAQDIATVAHGQLLRASGQVEPGSAHALRWIAAIKDVPVVPADLLKQAKSAPASELGAELTLLVQQCSAHLYHAATMITTFADRLPATIEHLRAAESAVEHLAWARADLSVDPVLSWRAVDEFRLAMGFEKIIAPF